MKLRLPIVLWGCVRSDDREYWKRTARVLRYCSRLFEFDEVILFSFLEPFDDILPADTKVVQIPMMDIDQFNIWVNKGAPEYLLCATPHCCRYFMSVHEDGFIINPGMWQPEFMAYDFIGAPWYDQVVGNGAFCIESRSLMDAKKHLPFYRRLDQPYDGRWFLPSDVYICREHRKHLEDIGFTFAPFFLAELFAIEQTKTAWRKSFGFHGRKVRPECYDQGWNQIDSFEKERIREL